MASVGSLKVYGYYRSCIQGEGTIQGIGSRVWCLGFRG